MLAKSEHAILSWLAISILTSSCLRIFLLFSLVGFKGTVSLLDIIVCFLNGRQPTEAKKKTSLWSRKPFDFGSLRFSQLALDALQAGNKGHPTNSHGLWLIYLTRSRLGRFPY